MSNFLDDVQKTVRDHQPTALEIERKEKPASDQKPVPASPAKSSRKELELDSLAGSHLKELSERKQKVDETFRKFEERKIENEMNELMSRSVDLFEKFELQSEDILKTAGPLPGRRSDTLGNKSARQRMTQTPKRNVMLPKEHNDLLIQIDQNVSTGNLVSGPLGSPNASYSLLKKKEEESLRRSDVRGLEIEESPEKASSHHSSASKSREERLFDIGGQIGTCFEMKDEFRPDATPVSPISSMLNSAEKEIKPKPELTTADLVEPVESPDEPEKGQEILVEEVRPQVEEREVLAAKVETREEEESWVLAQPDVESSSDTSVSVVKDERGEQADWLTDEILSMMIFSDVHDNPMHPFRNKRMVLDFRNKFPFNKPVGIDTSEAGVATIVSEIQEILVSNMEMEPVVRARKELGQRKKRDAGVTLANL